MKKQNPPTVKPFTQPNGITEFHVAECESWDDFELIIKFIVKTFSAEVMDKLDGICSRTWTLRVGPINFTVKHHDDIGNFFFSSDGSSEHEKLMKAIADSLNAQLGASGPNTGH